MSWFTTLPVQVQAAVIAAAVTLVGILARDVVFRFLQESRETRKSELEIFRRYADPLASAASSVLWRLNEIFSQRGRGDYLTSPVTEFEQYKRISTSYRLAALLGWIRAFRRELSFLEVRSRRQLAALKAAIRSLESALADGPHIELRRLEDLAELWDFSLPDNREERVALAIALNNIIKPKLHSQNVHVAGLLPEKDKKQLCLDVAELLGKELGIASLTPEFIGETTARAIQRMTINEAWIYRDWQAAIGDLMIKKVDYGGRAFEAVGFGDFERMWHRGGEEEMVWIDRLNKTFDCVDVSAEERLDARIQQLRRTMRSTAQLVIALAEIQPRRDVLLENTLKLARQVLQS